MQVPQLPRPTAPRTAARSAHPLAGPPTRWTVRGCSSKGGGSSPPASRSMQVSERPVQGAHVTPRWSHLASAAGLVGPFRA
eukprot:1182027-Prorocentrum_minimum.AAC.2